MLLLETRMRWRMSMCAGGLLLTLVMIGCAAEKERHRGDALHELGILHTTFRTQDTEKTRWEIAQKLFETGDFIQAREILLPLMHANGNSIEQLLFMGKLEFLLGNYTQAEEFWLTCVNMADGHIWERLEPEVYLLYVYYQTNQYAKGARLFTGMDKALKKVASSIEDELAIWEVMKAFGHEPPYQIDWRGRSEAVLPFLQTGVRELPLIEVEINGTPVRATLDTGAGNFFIPAELANSIGIEAIASSTGFVAGGILKTSGRGVANTLAFGDVVVHNIPVTITGGDGCLLGTNVLKQFLPTVDYLKGRLVLRPKNERGHLALQEELHGKTVTKIPFAMMGTHLLLARGNMGNQENLTFLVDCALADLEGGAAFIAPMQTLQDAGIAIPETTRIEGESEGKVELDIGYFPIETLSLGSLMQTDLRGMYGAFPPQLYHDALDFFVDGIISHNYLRQYSWTLDFSEMTMLLAQ